MDGEDFPLEDVQAACGEQAMKVMSALEVAEVQEAFGGWARAVFEMVRALERADLPRHAIAGILGGGVIEILQRMADEVE